MTDGNANQATDSGGREAAGDRPAGVRGFVTGMMLPLVFAFVILGGAQIGLAVLFLLNGHPAVVMPREQPDEGLSIGGWLPLGALGVVMLVLAWVMLRIRRSLRREPGA